MSIAGDTEARYRSRLVAAAAALRELESQVEQLRRELRSERSAPIAVTGIGCRLPGGADDPDSFWHLLTDGVDAVTEAPAGRYPAGESPTDRGRWGAFLSGVDAFDGEFFGVPPPEASRLDPQHRLLLEVAWEALENAGVVPARLAGTSTGVFVGMTTNDYLLLSMGGPYDGYTGTGTTHCFGPGRLSYFLGLRGPSMAVDTACSSSLVAVHLAVQSLRSGESSLALAGGVNLMLDSFVTETLSDLQALSPDGRCRTFDARANGFVRGEGCGVVVLKRLSDALADGDRVWAVVHGSAVNSDGRSAGLTVPNPMAQRELLRQALADAGVSAADIGFIETHGTGTSLGDPIEFEALRDVFGAPRADGSFCALGAVKTQIGHLEAAAGIAGLIKTVLALWHRKIPGNLHFSHLNPRMSLAGSPFVICRDSFEWPSGTSPRLAGVSSFGMSGTNAHVVVAEPPAPRPEDPIAGPVLVALSARTPGALTALALAHASKLEQQPDSLRDVAYTAAVRRGAYVQRAAVVASSAPELAGTLRAFAAGKSPPGMAHGRTANPAPRVTFVFSGQGAQWIGMGRDLLAAEPVFESVLTQCDKLLGEHAPFSIMQELTAPPELSRLNRTEIAQPALFGIQVALCGLLAHWGVRPDAVIGHSAGEVAAAHVAGALSLTEAARLIAARGRVMAKATGGRMVAVAAPAEDLLAELAAIHGSSAADGRVVVAAINDSSSTVLSGPANLIGEVVARLRERAVRCRVLPGDYAFHSPQMAPLAEEIGRELGEVHCGPAVCAMYSGVHGRLVPGTGLTTGYWMDNVREQVLFADAVGAAIADDHRVFVEVGPHAVLSGNVAQCLSDQAVPGTVVPTLRRKRPEVDAVLSALARLYTVGYPIDFEHLYPSGRVVSLPTYPWQRKRHWLRSSPARRSSWFVPLGEPPPMGHSSSTRLDVAGALAVFDHRLPAEELAGNETSVMLELVRSAAAAGLAVDQVQLGDAVCDWPLPASGNGTYRVQVVAQPDPDGVLVTAYCLAGEGWAAHMTVRATAVRAARSWPAAMMELAVSDRAPAVESAVRIDAATVLGLASPTDVPTDQVLLEMGLDSLMAVQLRHELAARTGLPLPATLAFDHPTPRAITQYLLDVLAGSAVTDSPGGAR